MTKNHYCLKAMGMINVLGSNPAEILPRLKSGEQTRFTRRKDLLLQKEVWVGEVSDPLVEVPGNLQQYASRNSRLLLTAYQQIEKDVKDSIHKFGPHRLGIVVGSSTSGIAEGENAVEVHEQTNELPKSYRYSQQELGSVAEILAEYVGILGPAYTISTACSSSAKVFASARNLLKLGLCDAVIVGGADSLCKMTVRGFNALELVSDKPCNPMSKNRSGITIGEGACLFLMTRDPDGIQLLGIGESSDAYHMSAPDPEGRGAYLSMQYALENAGMTSEQIAYVNLHGTGTIQNDRMEARAVNMLFPQGVPCSSTKALVGHMLGASGATEIGMCWLALAAKPSFLPPHCWDGVVDEEIPRLNLVERNQELKLKSGMGILSNAFAFGGSNCSVIIGKNPGA